MCKSLRKKQLPLWKIIQRLGIFLMQRRWPIQNAIENPQWQLTPSPLEEEIVPPLLSTGEGEIIDA